ncbi:2-keto-4-pentenoate hydratase [Glutamicibacter sp. NPDC087344]|uniref:2-keto-4-pentenoate hydratase n=1 Tax=Glutamicibacter sp. NPDC087344 TaxID=3363994 RepID=UPI0037F4D6D3
MEASSIHNVARDLHRAARSGAPVSTLGTETLDLQLATIIAAHGREIAELEGDRVVGYKIGLTAAAVRNSFNTDGPVHGYLLESTLLEAGGSISTQQMSKPAVEAEIAFIIGEELNNPEATVADVIAATKSVAPAIEIVDSRWKGGPANLPLLIADNTNAAAAVVGEPVDLPADIAAATSLLTVGATEHPGSTETVMGNPLESVAWLARFLAQTADGLKRGDVILSGSMNVPAPLGDSQTATATISGVGTVSVNFH